eukprot:451089_1
MSMVLIHSVCITKQRCNKFQQLLYIQIRKNISPFPLRPGYSLGSMVPPGLIQGMKQESKARSKILLTQQMCEYLESTERQLILEKNQITNNMDSSQTLPVNIQGLNKGITTLQNLRQTAMNQKIDAYNELTELQMKQLNNLSIKDSYDEAMSFNAFDSSIESAIDWHNSKIDYLDRSHDSMQINAYFFNSEQERDKGSTLASSVALTASASLNILGPRETAAVSSAVNDSVSKTSEIHAIESTLLLTAVATHRYIKQFNPININLEKLINCWNYFHTEDKIDNYGKNIDEQIKSSIEEVRKKGLTKQIHMITEEYLGSCMIGMVHFIKQEQSSAIQTSFSERAQVEMSAILGSITGNTGIAEQVAFKAANAASKTGIDVKFDLVCQGYLPKLESQVVKEAIKQLPEFSPDKTDSNSDTQSLSTNQSNSQLLNMNRYQGTAQSNSAAMIKATIMGLKQAYSNNYQVLDYNTFMN